MRVFGLPLSNVLLRRSRWHPTLLKISSSLFSSFEKLLEYTVNVPVSRPAPVWNRLANKIKDVDLETTFSDQNHLEKLRVSHDPCDTISKLEEELVEEMANALGKTGRKCAELFKVLDRLQAKYDGSSMRLEKNVLAVQFNEVRKLAESARRDLIIHRQCCGFTWQNHHIIMKEYPLPPKLEIKLE